MKIKELVPILEWLPGYKKSSFRGDLISGITVSIVLIPQGIAYALIAGLPPIYGLYCALVPQLIYAIFGSCRQVAIGPTPMDSLIVGMGVSTLALSGSVSYIEISILLALIVGSIQFLLGVFRLGFIVNFLSRPVIIGFTSAIALLIGVNQFGNLFGIDFIRSDEIYTLAKDIWQRIWQLNLKTTVIGLSAIGIILILRKINKKIPNALVVVAAGIIIIRFLGGQFSDVPIVGDIPSGLPEFSIPNFNIVDIRELFPVVISLVMIGYLETISIGKTLEAKQEEYNVRPNQELIALGLSNVMGSFFSAYPVSSGFSRSAINRESGATTGVSSLVSVAMVVIALLFLTPVLYYLPKTILAAIIIVSVFNLIGIREARLLWKSDTLDFWLLCITFLSTLLTGVQYGIFTGAAVSLGVFIFRASRPYVVELGKVPQANFYRNKERFKEVIIRDDVLVFRFDSQLFYANSHYFKSRLEQMTNEKGNSLKIIVLDAESINRIDSTAIEMLKDRIRFYKKKGIIFYFAGVKGPVRDSLFKGGILEIISTDHFFMRAYGAVNYYSTGEKEYQNKYSQYILKTHSQNI